MNVGQLKALLANVSDDLEVKLHLTMYNGHQAAITEVLGVAPAYLLTHIDLAGNPEDDSSDESYQELVQVPPPPSDEVTSELVLSIHGDANYDEVYGE